MYNNSRRGEALIDVIIGATLLGWFAVTMYGTVISLVKQSGAAAKRIQGVWVANSYMEELMGLPFTDDDDTENDLDDLDDFADYETETLDDYGFRVRTQTEGVSVNVESGEVRPQDISPPFTKITVTADKGGLDADEELVLQSLTPGATPDRIPLDVGTQNLNLSVPADHLIIDYNFQSAGGRDLDTRSFISHPFASKNLGWGQNGWYRTGRRAINSSIFSKNIFTHAGDNTGYGYEAVYIDLKTLRDEQPDVTEIKLEANASWYGRCNSGDIQLTIHAYVGGTVADVGKNYQEFNTVEETGKIVFNTNTKTGRRHRVRGATDGYRGRECDLLAYVTYNWDVGTLRCLLPNSTAENPIPCPVG